MLQMARAAAPMFSEMFGWTRTMAMFARLTATDIEKNVVHGSDAPETAAFEIGYFFNRFEIVA